MLRSADRTAVITGATDEVIIVCGFPDEDGRKFVGRETGQELLLRDGFKKSSKSTSIYSIDTRTWHLVDNPCFPSAKRHACVTHSLA